MFQAIELYAVWRSEAQRRNIRKAVGKTWHRRQGQWLLPATTPRCRDATKRRFMTAAW